MITIRRLVPVRRLCVGLVSLSRIASLALAAKTVPFRGEQLMPAKSKVMRPWTATDVRILKGLAVQKVDVDKISKKLRRTIPAVTMQASKLGISLSIDS